MASEIAPGLLPTAPFLLTCLHLAKLTFQMGQNSFIEQALFLVQNVVLSPDGNRLPPLSLYGFFDGDVTADCGLKLPAEYQIVPA